MLKIEMTPNLLGFKVTGDYGELDELYDAVWSVTMTDDPGDSRFALGTPDEVSMSSRLLALCYDLRHACQGHRNVELVDNGMCDEKASWHGIAAPEKNVCYSVEVLYPELMYEMMAINYLLKARKARILRERKSASALDLGAQMDMDAVEGCLRRFQGKVLDALSAECTPGRFDKIATDIGRFYSLVPEMYTQWLDVLDADYASMGKAKRAQSLATIVRDLAHFNHHEQYFEIKADIDAYMAKHPDVRGRSEVDVDVSWPKKLVW